jgi:hypothetical protein
MNDKQLHQYCIDWVKWVDTRAYYVAPSCKSILGQMQPSKSVDIPDARSNPDMQFFNMAIHTLYDMPEHKDGMVCFKLFYVVKEKHIKRTADNLGISKPTYYNRVKAFSKKAYSLSLSLKKVHEESNFYAEFKSKEKALHLKA